MSKVAALRVVRVFFCWTPTCFVVEHEENIPLFFVIKINQVFFEETKCQQTIWNKIIFDTFILEVFVDSLYVCKVFDRERQQLVRGFVLIESYNERSIKSVMTKQL